MTKYISAALGMVSIYLITSFVVMEFPLHVTEWENNDRLGLVVAMGWGAFAGFAVSKIRELD